MDLEPAIIVALDPGGSTGHATYHTEYKLLKAGEFSDEAHHQHLFQSLCVVSPDIIVCERFDYRNKKQTVDLRAREYIGVMRLYAQIKDVPVVMQAPMSHDRGLWTDDALKLVDAATEPCSTYPHANDATRHLLYYLTTGTAAWMKPHREYWLGKRKR